MTAFGHLDFMPGVVWSVFFLFQCSAQTSDWFPCPASPQLVPPDPSCSFPFQSLTSTTPTPRLLLCAKSSHQASFSPSWFLICTALLSCPTLGKHDMLSKCPFLLTCLASTASSSVWCSQVCKHLLVLPCRHVALSLFHTSSRHGVRPTGTPVTMLVWH